MRKLDYLFVIILFVILTSINFLVDLGIKYSNYAHYYKIGLIPQKKVDPQVMIFGSSVGEVGINTNEISKDTKLSTYNFSLNGTRFLQYRGLVNEFNEYSKNCGLIVFAETSFSLTSTTQLMEVDNYLPYIKNDNIYQSLMDIQPDLVWKIRNIPFFKFIVLGHAYYKASFIGYQNVLTKKVMVDTLKGFGPVDKVWDARLDSTNKASEKKLFPIDSLVVKKYRETIKALTDSGRSVLILITPIYKEAIPLLSNLNDLRRIFKSLENSKVHFKDYSNCELSNDKKFFYNNTHLNRIGATKFSALISADIINTNIKSYK